MLALIRDGIAGEERQLFGGDVEFDVREPFQTEQLEWLDGQGTVSRMVELRTMLGTANDDLLLSSCSVLTGTILCTVVCSSNH